MPRSATTILGFVLVAFSIGFNTIRYPVVWEMVNPARANETAEPATVTPPVEPERFAPRVRRIVFSGRQAFVAMVQTAHLGERDDLALLRTLHWSWFRGIFVQAQVGPTSVVIGEIGFEQAVQMSLIEHDNVVLTLAADRANQPFDIRRLPG